MKKVIVAIFFASLVAGTVLFFMELIRFMVMEGLQHVLGGLMFFGICLFIYKVALKDFQ